jgi:hypothetical protein
MCPHDPALLETPSQRQERSSIQLSLWLSGVQGLALAAVPKLGCVAFPSPKHWLPKVLLQLIATWLDAHMALYSALQAHRTFSLVKHISKVICM